MKKQRRLSPDSVVSEEDSKPEQTGEELKLSSQDAEDLQMGHRVVPLLGAYGHPALRDLKVSVHAGSVILQGTVPTYYTVAGLKCPLSRHTDATVSGWPMDKTKWPCHT